MGDASGSVIDTGCIERRVFERLYQEERDYIRTLLEQDDGQVLNFLLSKIEEGEGCSTKDPTKFQFVYSEVPRRLPLSFDQLVPEVDCRVCGLYVHACC